MNSDNGSPHSNRGQTARAGQRKEQLGALLLAALMAVIGVAWLEPWMMWATRNVDLARTEPLLPPLLMVAIVLMGAVTTRWAATHSQLWKVMAARVVLAACAALILVQVIVFGVRSPLDFLAAFIRWNGFFSAEVIVFPTCIEKSTMKLMNASYFAVFPMTFPFSIVPRIIVSTRIPSRNKRKVR